MATRKTSIGIASIMVIIIGCMVVFTFYPDNSNKGVYIEQVSQTPVKQGVIRQKKDSSSLQVYPNPARNNLHVVVPATAVSYLWLGIYNTQGQLLKQQSALSGRVVEINIGTLPAGSYMLRMKDRKGHAWSATFTKTG
jgi:hypothetical protein